MENKRAKETNLKERHKSLKLPEFLQRISKQRKDSNVKKLTMFTYTINYFYRSQKYKSRYI